MNSNISEAISLKISEIVALKLWETGAIKINFENPFKLVSGKLSPIYINCRLLISDSEFCSLFIAFAKVLLKDNRFDIIAGGETAGIPYAGFLSPAFSLPMIYIRKKPKDYGIASLIEGKLDRGQKVLLVEDLITDAGSKLHFINEIRKTGATIESVFVVFDRQQGGGEALKKEGINLISLTDLNQLISIGVSTKILAPEEALKIDSYLNKI